MYIIDDDEVVHDIIDIEHDEVDDDEIDDIEALDVEQHFIDDEGDEQVIQERDETDVNDWLLLDISLIEACEYTQQHDEQSRQLDDIVFIHLQAMVHSALLVKF